MVRENGGNRFSFSSGEKAGMREISKSGLGWRSAIGQGDANWGRNRVAVEGGLAACTQGSSCLATLGFGPEFRWNSQRKFEALYPQAFRSSGGS